MKYLKLHSSEFPRDVIIIKADTIETIVQEDDNRTAIKTTNSYVEVFEHPDKIIKMMEESC